MREFRNGDTNNVFAYHGNPDTATPPSQGQSFRTRMKPGDTNNFTFAA